MLSNTCVNLITFTFNITHLFFINSTIFCSMLIMLYTLQGLIEHISFRKKFFFFFLFVGQLTLVGFYYSLEGLILILVLTELLIIFIFLLVFLPLKITAQAQYKLNTNLIYLIFSCGFLIYVYVLSLPHLNFFYHQNFYLTTGFFTANDFFIFFYFFFIQFNVAIYLISILLGLFSIVFILIFFTLKHLTQQKKLKQKKIYLLRKQHLMHQSVYARTGFTFQR